ncbi:MAG: polyamine aminopropyltransferase [Candidatus Sumerlaeota bacterium]
MSGGQWREERLHDGFAARYRIERVLAETTTPFQHVELVESERFGKMLWLDNVVQCTEADEFVYHEMMVHVPLLAHPAPRRVLIIGGGDGGALREVLRHPEVERAVMVEIDRQVVDFCREHLPSLSRGAFDDPRVELVYDDGAKFVRETGETFDVVIVDSSDPIGPAQVLFTRDFYADIARCLSDNGILVRQTGSIFLQPEEQVQAMIRLGEVFLHNALYLFDVPTYVGGHFSAAFSSMRIDPTRADIDELSKRMERLEGPTRYYSPALHQAAFCLPEYLRRRLDKQEQDA